MPQTLRFSPSGPPANVAGDLTTLRWVDPATTVAASEQDGSSATPFSTIQDAINSLLAEGTLGGTVLCVDGDYGNTPAAWASPDTSAEFEIIGFGNAFGIGPITITGECQLSLEKLQIIGAVTCPDCSVLIEDIIAQGSLTALVLEASGVIGGTIAGTSALILLDCVVSGSLTITNTLGNAVTIRNTYLPNGTVFTSGQIDNLRIDPLSWVYMVGQGVAGPVSGLVVNNLTYDTGCTLGAIISIIVPAVLAGQVGYVDTTLVGTDLDGLLFANQAVVVNPRSNLVAAGAGGALVNGWLPADNTLRTTFIGPLAGGATNFNVTVVI